MCWQNNGLNLIYSMHGHHLHIIILSTVHLRGMISTITSIHNPDVTISDQWWFSGCRSKNIEILPVCLSDLLLCNPPLSHHHRNLYHVQSHLFKAFQQPFAVCTPTPPPSRLQEILAYLLSSSESAINQDASGPWSLIAKTRSVANLNKFCFSLAFDLYLNKPLFIFEGFYEKMLYLKRSHDEFFIDHQRYRLCRQLIFWSSGDFFSSTFE